jgi:DNA-binding transcriptional LysR family regulator
VHVLHGLVCIGSIYGGAVSRLAGTDLNLLVALDALLELGSVSAAAKRLGLSQSAMSHALARLRALTGDRLSVRSGRVLVPTARALELHQPIRAALESIEGALAQPRPLAPGEIERTVRIAAIDLAQNVLIPELSRGLAQHAPGIDLVVVAYDEAVARTLSSGDVDLAIGLARNLPRLHQQVLYRRERFVCVVRRGHPCLGRKLTPARFARMHHVLISPRGVARGFVDRALAEKKLKRRVVLVVPGFTAAALAVARSDFIMTVSEHVATTLAPSLPIVLLPPPLWP